MKLKKIFLPVAAVALAFGLAACGNDDKEGTEDTEGEVDQEAIDKMNEKLAEQQVDSDIIVAIVNDEELNGETYNTVLQNIHIQYQEMGIDPTTEEVIDQIKSHTLDEVVNQTLFLQEAKAEDTEVLPEEIDNHYGLLVEQFGDEDALKTALESENIDMETFRESIADSILYSKHLEKVAPTEDVSDEDIQAYYDSIAEQSGEDEEVPPLEDLSDMIRNHLAQEKQQTKFTAHLEKLKDEAKVELKI